MSSDEYDSATGFKARFLTSRRMRRRRRTPDSPSGASTPLPAVDYSLVHAVPGYGKPLDYVPDTSDPLFVGAVLPSALSMEDTRQSGGAVYARHSDVVDQALT
jgi:hypothetical protein